LTVANIVGVTRNLDFDIGIRFEAVIYLFEHVIGFLEKLSSALAVLNSRAQGEASA